MTPSQSRTVRIFLSSTFRDFAPMRDLMVRNVLVPFVALEPCCHESVLLAGTAINRCVHFASDQKIWKRSRGRYFLTVRLRSCLAPTSADFFFGRFGLDGLGCGFFLFSSSQAPPGVAKTLGAADKPKVASRNVRASRVSNLACGTMR